MTTDSYPGFLSQTEGSSDTHHRGKLAFPCFITLGSSIKIQYGQELILMKLRNDDNSVMGVIFKEKGCWLRFASIHYQIESIRLSFTSKALAK